jgi:hypothetical protein
MILDSKKTFKKSAEGCKKEEEEEEIRSATTV